MLPMVERPYLPPITPKIVPKLLANISRMEKFLPGTNVCPNSKATPRGIMRNAANRLLFPGPKDDEWQKSKPKISLTRDKLNQLL